MLVNSDGCLKKSLCILKAACSQLVFNSIEETIVFLKGKGMRIRLMLLSY